MVALRTKGQRFAVHSGLALALYAAMPGQIAQQDLASLLTFHSTAPSRNGLFLSFSALRTATFSLPRASVFAIPELPENLRPRANEPEVTGSIGRTVSATESFSEYNEYVEPQSAVINRASKGDRLPNPVKVVAAVAARTVTLADQDAANAIRQDVPPIESTEAADDAEPRADQAGTLAELSDPVGPLNGSMIRVTGLFFNNDTAVLPALPFQHNQIVLASLGDVNTLPEQGSTTLASKGQVTGEEAQPRSPAERLGLKGKALAKAEKCLADAIYFESRGEVKKGQIAVSQVVVNRAFSGFYPNDICGVVYQNANRYLACQFTFACEGKKLIVEEPDMWKQATEIAHDMLGGKLWLDEIGKATHYHASWVRPTWVREMRKIDRIGVHTFYRPRAWEG
ncbi:MAG TPA: cell wall hydrolase [Xanthobacteraceae bacterium]|jgi:spore germination cell wall hydrolase CwlJ-like protein|nr:cell wall hydrolase [Xanthobacteraceae bacterium]